MSQLQQLLRRPHLPAMSANLTQSNELKAAVEKARGGGVRALTLSIDADAESIDLAGELAPSKCRRRRPRALASYAAAQLHMRANGASTIYLFVFITVSSDCFRGWPNGGLYGGTRTAAAACSRHAGCRRGTGQHASRHKRRHSHTGHPTLTLTPPRRRRGPGGRLQLAVEGPRR